MSSKHRPGTLPINAYEENNGPTELFDVSTLQSGNAMESACQEKTPESGMRETRMMKATPLMSSQKLVNMDQ